MALLAAQLAPQQVLCESFFHESLICHQFVSFHYIQGFIQDFELGGRGWGVGGVGNRMVAA